MPLFISIQILIHEIIQALNWTLLHSLWQGMILSLVAGGIVFFTKKNSPALRYNLLTTSLLCFVIGVGSTFSILVIKAKQFANIVQPVPGPSILKIDPAVAAADDPGNLAVTSAVINFFNANADWIVSIWLLVIGLRFIRLSAGLYGVYQLKRRQISAPSEYWQKRITELGRQLYLRRPVQLLESGIVKVPAVIGYFKPVILFPLGLLASLPVNEVEAILMHELSHIRRKDFLVNMLQNIVEIIFFFNPAVLWVSSLIKSERENCCDDLAVSQTESKQNYIRALVSFQGFNPRLINPLTNGFPGEKNQLMNRVKRIIYNNNKTLNNMEKKFLAAGMIVTSVFIFAFSAHNDQQPSVVKKSTSRYPEIILSEKPLPGIETINDTIPGKEAAQKDNIDRTITVTKNGKKYNIIIENDQVAELYVDGKKIPAEKMAGYKTVTDNLLAQSKADMEQSEIDLIESQKEMEESQNDLVEAQQELLNAKIEMERAREEMEQEMEQSKKEIEQAQVEMELSKKEMLLSISEMEKSKLQMGDDMKQAQNDMLQAQKELEQSKKEMIQSMAEMEKAKQQMGDDMKQAQKALDQSKKEMEQSKRDMQQSMKHMEQSKKEMEQSKKLQEGIIADFIKENIISNKAGLSSFKLSNEELIVNGVKQSDAIHKRFKDKYVKGNNWTMNYNNN